MATWVLTQFKASSSESQSYPRYQNGRNPSPLASRVKKADIPQLFLARGLSLTKLLFPGFCLWLKCWNPGEKRTIITRKTAKNSGRQSQKEKRSKNKTPGLSQSLSRLSAAVAFRNMVGTKLGYLPKLDFLQVRKIHVSFSQEVKHITEQQSISSANKKC